MDFQLIFEMVKTLSIAATAAVAIAGIQSWRREYVEKGQIELAEEVLAMFYEANDKIAEIRSPFGFVGEGSTRQASENETPEQSVARNNAYVVIERYQRHSEFFNKLFALRYRFISKFTEPAAAPFNELRSVINDIMYSSKRLARHWERQGRVQMDGEQFERHLREMHEAEAIFWAFHDPDPIAERMSRVIADIEQTCRKAIQPESFKAKLLRLLDSWAAR